MGGNARGTCLSVATVGTSGSAALTARGVGGSGLDKVSGGPRAENDWIDSGNGDVCRWGKDGGGGMAIDDDSGGGTVAVDVVGRA